MPFSRRSINGIGRAVSAIDVRKDAAAGGRLEHDPEKWIPVFRKDHAPPKI
jgi:hypothetical protein